MKRPVTYALLLATLVFVASGIVFALQPIAHGSFGGDPALQRLVDPVSVYMNQSQGRGTSLLALFLQPRHAALWLLLIAVWVSVIAHAVLTMQRDSGNARGFAADQFPLIGTLLIGAIWPWMIGSHPSVGVLGSVSMLIGLLILAVRGAARGRRIHDSPMIGVFGAWVTIVTFSAFGMLMVEGGASVILAATLVLLMACAAGGVLQLQTQGSGAYTITLIFAFLGIAAAMLETSPMVSIAAVMAIAAMTFVLVQVTT